MKFPRAGGKLDNTKQAILRLMRRGGTASPEWIVSQIWPLSRQPEKKANTVRKHLAEMERRGLVRNVGGVWIRLQNGGQHVQ